MNNLNTIPPPLTHLTKNKARTVKQLIAFNNAMAIDAIIPQATVNPLLSLETLIIDEVRSCTDVHDLLSWLDDANTRNVGYVKNRQELYESLEAMMQTRPIVASIYCDWMTPFWQQRFTTVKTFLQSRKTGGRATQRGNERNDNDFAETSSDATLAFTKAISEMFMSIQKKTNLCFRNAQGRILVSHKTPISQQVLTDFFTVPIDEEEEEEEEGEDIVVQSFIPFRPAGGAFPPLTAVSAYDRDDLMTTPFTDAQVIENSTNTRLVRIRVDQVRELHTLDALTRTLATMTTSIAAINTNVNALLARPNTGGTTAPQTGGGNNTPQLPGSGPSAPTGGLPRPHPVEEEAPVPPPRKTKTIEVEVDDEEEDIVVESRLDFQTAFNLMQQLEVASDCIAVQAQVYIINGDYNSLRTAALDPTLEWSHTTQGNVASGWNFTKPLVEEGRIRTGYLGVHISYVMPNNTIICIPQAPYTVVDSRHANFHYRRVSPTSIDGLDGDLEKIHHNTYHTLRLLGCPSNGVIPDTVLDGNVTKIHYNTRQILYLLGAPSNGITIQSSLMNGSEVVSLHIADTEQLIEAPTVTKTAAAAFDTNEGDVDNWDIKKILERPVRLTNEIFWNSEAAGTLLVNAEFPNAWLSQQDRFAHFRQMLNMFNMARMDVVFRLTVNATPMHGGILAMFFDFYDRYTQNGNPMNAVSASNFDPVYLDLSKGTTAELTVPFCAVSQYISRQHGSFTSQFLGKIKVVTMSGIVKGPAASNVDVRVYAYVKNVDVAVLQRPENGDYVVPQATIVRSITSFAHSFLPGMQKVYPLALEDNYELSREASCRVESIGSVYGLIGSTTWSSTTPTGSAAAPLFQIPVHPMMFSGWRDSFPAGTVINAPRIAHLGRHYCYWNGTLEYKIQVACSNAHSGKLLINFVPGPSSVATLNTSRTMNPNILLDIKENHEIEFTVPFISPTAWKPTYIAQPFADIQRTATGFINIFNVASIISAVDATSNVTVNVYVRAAPDFQYSVPRNGIAGAMRYGEIMVQSAQLTSVKAKLRMNNEDFNDIYKVLRRYVPLGNAIVEADTVGNIGLKGSCTIVPVMPIMPDVIDRHALGIVSKGFSFWKGSMNYKIKINSSTDAVGFEVIHCPLMGIPASATTLPFSYGYQVPDDDTALTGALSGSQTFHPDKDKEWEITVPFYSMYEWLYMPLKTYKATKLPLLSTNNGCIVIRPLWKNVSYNFTISVSIGQDFEFAAPTAFPVVRRTVDRPFGRNFEEQTYPTGTSPQIVAQSFVHPLDPPFHLRNPLFRSAWNALPLESPARASKTKFNRHYYKWCELCQCNVFMYLHEERCRPDQSEDIIDAKPQATLDVEPQILGFGQNPIPGMMEFFNELRGTNDLFARIATEIKNEDGRGSGEYFSKVIVDAVTTLCENASVSVKNWFTQLMPSVDWKLFISTLVAGFAVYSMRDYLESPLAKIVLGSISAIATHKFVNFVSELIKSEDNPIRVQQGSALSMPMLMQLCCGVLAFFLNLNKAGSTARVIKSLGDLGRSFSGIKSGVEAMTVFTAFVQEKLIPEISTKDGMTLRGMMSNSLEILDKVAELNLEEMKVRCLTEAEIKDDVLHTFDDLSALIKVAIASNAPASIMQPLTRAMTKMEKLRTEVVAYKGNERYRVDPFHVCLYGLPGLGKSAVMHQIVEDVRGTQEWPKDNVSYSRTVDTEYWDGYMGQSAVIYDDLAQVVKDGVCDITELIGLKSNAPYMVHMASLNDKGKYFTSKLIVSSTNVAMIPTFGGLRSPAAFHRRRNILVEMVRKQIDGAPAPFGGGPNDQGHCDYYLMDPITGHRTSEALSFEEFMQVVIARTKAHYDEQKALVKKNTTDLRPSTVAQAIIDTKLAQSIPGVVTTVTDGDGDVFEEFEILDAEAQNMIDNSSSEERRHYLRAWTDAWKAAYERRDFSMMTSAFTFASKMKICQAMAENSDEGLSVAEKTIFRAKSASDRAKSSYWALTVGIKEQASRVSGYFQDLWNSQDPTTRKYLATSIVGMGVIGLAFAMSKHYSKDDGKDRSTNEIPISVFTESVPDSYQSRVRKTHHYSVEAQTKTPHYMTVRAPDDYEGDAKKFEVFKAENPGIIPYRNALSYDGWFPKVMGETYEWRDYVAYCRENDYDLYAHPESGIDDYKTRRSGRKMQFGIESQQFSRPSKSIFDQSNVTTESGIDDYKTRYGNRPLISIEGSAMTTDVPADIIDLSPEELEEEMEKLQVRGEIVRKTQTLATSYEIEATSQATSDPDTAAFIDNRLLDNLVMVCQPKSTIRMRAIMLKDKFMAVPKHFFVNKDATWTMGDLFYLRVRNRPYPQSFDPSRLYICPKRDVAIYLLSESVSGAVDIVKRIAGADDHASFKETTGSLLGLMSNLKNECWVRQRGIPSIRPMLTKDNMKVRYDIGKEKHILHGYRYYADTVNGECGSLLIQNNRFAYAKILGFHVAASLQRQLAFSEMLVREEIEAGINILTKTTGYISGGCALEVLQKMTDAGLVVQGSINPAFGQLSDGLDIMGKLPSNLVRRSPEKTGIFPSALQGIIDIEPQTEPAILSRKDDRCPPNYDPLIQAVNKFHQPVKPFRNDHIKIVVEHMTKKYRKYDGVIGKRLMSLSESINGIAVTEYADSINMKSAEGSFWNSERPRFAHNKEWMFGKRMNATTGREEYHITHKPLLEKIVHRLKEAQEGRRVISVTQECLKDERRAKKKIYCEKPSTRCFTIMPVDYTILFRQYFFDFIAMLMVNRGELCCQVGLNATSIEWTALALELRRLSEKVFAGDYAKFDSTEMAELLSAVCDIANAWYDDGPVNAQVRKVLIQESFDRFTCVLDAMIHIEQGLPSGFPGTAPFNSLVNEMYMYLAWLGLAPPEKQPLHICDANVVRKAYGDDHVDSVTDDGLEFYNQRTFGEFMERHGITYTDAQKNPWRTCEPYTTLDQVSFLKRDFVPHHEFRGFYLAPLEKKSIEDRLLWITDSKFATPDELLAENIKNSMQDAYQHGMVYFNQLYERIFSALKAIDKEKLMTPISYTSEDMAWISTIQGIDTKLPAMAEELFGMAIF